MWSSGLTISVLTATIIIQHCGGQINFLGSSAADTCINSLRQYGLCIDLPKCIPLKSILNQRSVNLEALQFVHDSICSDSGKVDKVCCTISPLPDFNSSAINSTSISNSNLTLVLEPDPRKSVQIETQTEIILNQALVPKTKMEVEDNTTLIEEKEKLLPKSCGNPIVLNRILGGSDADLGQFPWMVLIGIDIGAIGEKLLYGCGGTLISNKYVLTAAHCVNLQSNWSVKSVRVGVYNSSEDKSCDSSGKFCTIPEDIKIDKIISYPAYNQTGNVEHDIAIIRLKRKVKFGVFVSPICIPNMTQAQDALKDKFLIAAGWGLQSGSREAEENLANVLQYAKMPILPQDECKSENEKEYGIIDDSRFCAGGHGKRDTCKGDSGGPLMLEIMSGSTNKTSRPHFYQFGITSGGPWPCGQKGKSGVYMNVAFYRSWILGNLEP